MLLVRRHHPPSTVSRRVGLGHAFHWLYFIFLAIERGQGHLSASRLVTLHCSMTFMLSPRRLPHGAPAFQ